MDGYDKTVYDNLLGDIDTWKKKDPKNIDSEGYITLRMSFFQNMLAIVYEGYNNALKNYDNTSLKKMNLNFDGIKRLKTDMNKQDERIDEVEKLQALFNDISKFSAAYIKPKFENYAWTSFESNKSSKLSRAKKFRNNPLYPRMSHVPGFANKLSETTILNNYSDSQKNTFYNTLSDDIIAYFDNSTNEFDQFNSVVDKFEKEAGSYSTSYKNLSSVLTRYYENLQNNNGSQDE